MWLHNAAIFKHIHCEWKLKLKLAVYLKCLKWVAMCEVFFHGYIFVLSLFFVLCLHIICRNKKTNSECSDWRPFPCKYLSLNILRYIPDAQQIHIHIFLFLSGQSAVRIPCAICALVCSQFANSAAKSAIRHKGGCQKNLESDGKEGEGALSGAELSHNLQIFHFTFNWMARNEFWSETDSPTIHGGIHQRPTVSHAAMPLANAVSISLCLPVSLSLCPTVAT